jgi:cation diffusion facilitator family transporter
VVAATAQVAQAGVRRVLWITLFLNLGVSGGKVAVGLLSGSLSMLADGYHSLVDGSNNVIGLIVVAFAYAPPDRGHPYGHRKFETTATLFIGGALLLLAYSVVEGAVSEATEARLPRIGWLNWAVMLATMAVNLFVTWYETREGRRLQSEYLVADATHTASDLYVSLGVIASFAGAQAGLAWADVMVAIGIAGMIAYQGGKILVGCFHVLTDSAVIAPEALAVVVRAIPGVLGCREVRSRGVPGAIYLDLVVHVDGDLPLRAAHALADQIEAVLRREQPGIVDVLVHLEPASPP